MRQTWSIGWFERVTRRLQVVGSRRGTFRFVSAELRIADLFGSGSQGGSARSSPPTEWCRGSLPVRSLVSQSPMIGATRTTRGLYEDPSLFAGVRPYQPGDQLRRIHWKATARVGRPVSRRFDPAREREVVLAVDIQTITGASWMLNWDDDAVEGLCVAALSLARSFIEDGIAVGLAVNAFSDRPQRTVYVPGGRRPDPAHDDRRPARRRQPVSIRHVRSACSAGSGASRSRDAPSSHSAAGIRVTSSPSCAD